MQALKFHAEPDFDPDVLSSDIAPLRAGERIRLLHRQLGDHLVATTSFGIQAAVMLHLIHEKPHHLRFDIFRPRCRFAEVFQNSTAIIGIGIGGLQFFEQKWLQRKILIDDQQMHCIRNTVARL